jgi:hypothetical protein
VSLLGSCCFCILLFCPCHSLYSSPIPSAALPLLHCSRSHPFIYLSTRPLHLVFTHNMMLNYTIKKKLKNLLLLWPNQRLFIS